MKKGEDVRIPWPYEEKIPAMYDQTYVDYLKFEVDYYKKLYRKYLLIARKSCSKQCQCKSE